MASTILQDATNATNRIILLLDLDCFYASCECVRLGLDARTTPLALLQWNSVLAVTYPAREQYQIKRGDSWQIVKQKSAGQCLAIHVPILTNQEETEAKVNSINEEYARIFQTNDKHAAHQEIGERRNSTQGKASIERYRIASARIFQHVLHWLEENAYNVVLERASIDEFYLDVTKACRDEQADLPWLEQSQKESVVVCEELSDRRHRVDGTPDEALVRALQRGCALAYGIRQAVRTSLGFTMSAGVCFNKTLAKLSASYGKPNGQAVTFPHAIGNLLNSTEIRKCRNLGGKLGSKIQSLLLPFNAPPTVGSIAKYLSLPELTEALQSTETAKWVYDLARGIEHEPVASKNESALTKSITAFKSLPFQSSGGHTLDDAIPWIELLARDVASRVERDSVRNKRYPRTCNIQYASNFARQNKSIRVPFPAERLNKTIERIEALVKSVVEQIKDKEGQGFRVTRVGICATDFVCREANAIDSYFNVTNTDITVQPSNGATPQKVAQKNETKNVKKPETISNTQASAEDSDLELAKQLQATYDREYRALELLGKRKSAPNTRAPPPKNRRIDSFFQKR